MLEQNKGKIGNYFGGMKIPFLWKVLNFPVYLFYKRYMERYSENLMIDIEGILDKLSKQGLLLENTCGIKTIKSIY